MKLAREIDELGSCEKWWRAMLSLFPGSVKLAKEIEESAASAVVGSGMLSHPKTSCAGGEGTEERVMTSHTETCESCEVTSVEEGHDVVCVTVFSEPSRYVISKETFVTRCVDVCVLSVVAKDTVSAVLSVVAEDTVSATVQLAQAASRPRNAR